MQKKHRLLQSGATCSTPCLLFGNSLSQTCPLGHYNKNGLIFFQPRRDFLNKHFVQLSFHIVHNPSPCYALTIRFGYNQQSSHSPLSYSNFLLSLNHQTIDEIIHAQWFLPNYFHLSILAHFVVLLGHARYKSCFPWHQKHSPVQSSAHILPKEKRSLIFVQKTQS